MNARRASYPPASDVAASPARWLGEADAAAFERFVVPRYLAWFAERLIEMIAPCPDARVCHVQCRTGYPDTLLATKLPNVHVHGCDPSDHAIEVARAQAAANAGSGLVAEYRVVDGYPLPFPDGAFSHAFTVHPLTAPEERMRLLDELARIVAPQGQALVAMPLRGSFIEIADLLRECALKHELTDLPNAVEAAMQLRPTDDLLARELEAAGFEFVDVDLRARTLRFDNGRAFFADPVTQLLLLPEFRVNLGVEVDVPFAYVRDAIDKYWSDATFELSVNVGVVSGRRRG